MPRYHFAVLNTSSRHEVMQKAGHASCGPLALDSVDVRPTKAPSAYMQGL